MTEKLFRQISFWQWMSKCYTDLTIINRLCISDYNWYLIMIFCPIAHHLCMTLPFIMCRVVNQCWSVRYENLFTLSFISNDFASVKWYYCRRNPSFIMGKMSIFQMKYFAICSKRSKSLLSPTSFSCVKFLYVGSGSIICLFVVYRPTREFFTHMETSPLPVKGCKFWPMLGTHGHWAVRVLQRTTPTVTRDIRL